MLLLLFQSETTFWLFRRLVGVTLLQWNFFWSLSFIRYKQSITLCIKTEVYSMLVSLQNTEQNTSSRLLSYDWCLCSLCCYSFIVWFRHRGWKPDNGFVISGSLNCATVSLPGSDAEFPTMLHSQTGQAGHAGWIGSANCRVCVMPAHREGAFVDEK